MHSKVIEEVERLRCLRQLASCRVDAAIERSRHENPGDDSYGLSEDIADAVKLFVDADESYRIAFNAAVSTSFRDQNP